jgi:NTE family protein
MRAFLRALGLADFAVSCEFKRLLVSSRKSIKTRALGFAITAPSLTARADPVGVARLDEPTGNVLSTGKPERVFGPIARAQDTGRVLAETAICTIQTLLRKVSERIFETAVPKEPRFEKRIMAFSRAALSFILALLLLIVGCATRQVNSPISHYDPRSQLQLVKQWQRGDKQDLVILAFSGGGTRAAAFSYGVLEALRRIQIVTKAGRKIRLLDEVDIITGVSGGSFTALAYGLYGEQLFDDYETRFLKRNVQGELMARFLNPLNWSALWSAGGGRSELAAQLYDEILFNGATYADLYRAGGPVIVVSATDLATSSRILFIQQNFNVMCADVGPIRLSRAAAASSAVPVVLSPITINNYGGSCGYQAPAWLRALTDRPDVPRPAARYMKRLEELQALANGVEDPYLHLVDGGISDNLGLRGVLDVLETFQALREAGLPSPFDHIRRIIIFVVNSLSTPSTQWNQSENPPGSIDILIKAAGVPIDRYSGEMVEQLKDIDDRWKALRRMRDSVAFARDKDPAMAYVVNAPDAEIYVIDVSFQELKDKSERDALNQLPTSFHLPHKAVDRLRAAAATIILDSPDLQQMLKDEGARIVDRPATGTTVPSAAVAIPTAATTAK